MSNFDFSIKKFTKDYDNIVCYQVKLPSATVYLSEDGVYIGDDKDLSVYLINKMGVVS